MLDLDLTIKTKSIEEFAHTVFTNLTKKKSLIEALKKRKRDTVANALYRIRTFRNGIQQYKSIFFQLEGN